MQQGKQVQFSAHARRQFQQQNRLPQGETVQFNAHARLKDIVGRGLINDDNVAIIELIKNSKDAESNSVHISFSHAKEENDDSLLIIQDSGQGMSEKDIRDKWLNIAYSDKRNARRKSDNKAYAGSMGIGRFSCDRLGKKLELYTRREHRQDWLCLEIDWTKFEVDNKDKADRSNKVSHARRGRS